MFPDSRRKSSLSGRSSVAMVVAVHGVNCAVYEARVRELTDAVTTVLSTAR